MENNENANQDKKKSEQTDKQKSKNKITSSAKKLGSDLGEAGRRSSLFRRKKSDAGGSKDNVISTSDEKERKSDNKRTSTPKTGKNEPETEHLKPSIQESARPKSKRSVVEAEKAHPRTEESGGSLSTAHRVGKISSKQKAKKSDVFPELARDGTDEVVKPGQPEIAQESKIPVGNEGTKPDELVSGTIDSMTGNQMDKWLSEPPPEPTKVKTATGGKKCPTKPKSKVIPESGAEEKRTQDVMVTKESVKDSDVKAGVLPTEIPTKQELPAAKTSDVKARDLPTEFPTKQELPAEKTSDVKARDLPTEFPTKQELPAAKTSDVKARDLPTEFPIKQELPAAKTGEILVTAPAIIKPDPFSEVTHERKTGEDGEQCMIMNPVNKKTDWAITTSKLSEQDALKTEEIRSSESPSAKTSKEDLITDAVPLSLSKPASEKPSQKELKYLPSQPASEKPSQKEFTELSSKPTIQDELYDAKYQSTSIPASEKPSETSKPAFTKPSEKELTDSEYLATFKPPSQKPSQQGTESGYLSTSKPASTQPSEKELTDPEYLGISQLPSLKSSQEFSELMSTSGPASVKPSEKEFISPSKPASVKPSEKEFISPSKPASVKPSEKEFISPSKPASVKPSEKEFMPTSKPASVKPSEKEFIPTSKPVSAKTSEKSVTETDDTPGLRNLDTSSMKTSKKDVTGKEVSATKVASVKPTNEELSEDEDDNLKCEILTPTNRKKVPDTKDNPTSKGPSVKASKKDTSENEDISKAKFPSAYSYQDTPTFTPMSLSIKPSSEQVPVIEDKPSSEVLSAKTSKKGIMDYEDTSSTPTPPSLEPSWENLNQASSKPSEKTSKKDVTEDAQPFWRNLAVPAVKGSKESLKEKPSKTIPEKIATDLEPTERMAPSESELSERDVSGSQITEPTEDRTVASGTNEVRPGGKVLVQACPVGVSPARKPTGKPSKTPPPQSEPNKEEKK